MDQVYKVYTYRWCVLFAYGLLVFSNAMLWVTFAPISDITSNYFANYGSTTNVNMLANIFLILFLPGTILGVISMKYLGLRGTLLISGFLSVLGSILRYVAVLNKSTLGDMNTYIIVLIGQSLPALAQPPLLNVAPAVASIWFAVNERDVATTIGCMLSPLGNAAGQVMPAIFVTQTQNDSGDYEVHGMPDLMLAELIICIITFMLGFSLLKDAPITPPSHSTMLKQTQSRKDYLPNRSSQYHVHKTVTVDDSNRRSIATTKTHEPFQHTPTPSNKTNYSSSWRPSSSTASSSSSSNSINNHNSTISSPNDNTHPSSSIIIDHQAVETGSNRNSLQTAEGLTRNSLSNRLSASHVQHNGSALYNMQTSILCPVDEEDPGSYHDVFLGNDPRSSFHSVGDKSPSTSYNMNQAIQSFLSESRSLWHNSDYICLFVAFSLGVGFFNSLLELLNQLIIVHGYRYDFSTSHFALLSYWDDRVTLHSNDDAGTFGAVFIVCGLVGAGCSSYLMERTKMYRPVLQCGVLFALASLILFICMLYRDNYWPLLISFGLAGLFVLAMFPGNSIFNLLAPSLHHTLLQHTVMLQNCAECTYPTPEELSTGYMYSGSNILSVGLVFAIQVLIDEKRFGPPPFYPSNMFILGMGIVFAVFIFLYRGKYHRLDNEHLTLLEPLIKKRLSDEPVMETNLENPSISDAYVESKMDPSSPEEGGVTRGMLSTVRAWFNSPKKAKLSLVNPTYGISNTGESRDASQSEGYSSSTPSTSGLVRIGSIDESSTGGTTLQMPAGERLSTWTDGVNSERISGVSEEAWNTSRAPSGLLGNKGKLNVLVNAVNQPNQILIHRVAPLSDNRDS